MIIHRELRLGLTPLGGVVEVTPECKARFVCTGQADVIAISDDGLRACIIDTKTGRGDYEHAAGNAQLRTLASLVARRYRAQSVRVAIVQPWAGRPTVADFDAEALEHAHYWLGNVLVKAMRATPGDLNAGDWCKWCPAKATCPALRETALEPVERMTISLPADDKVARQALFARAMDLPADALARYMRGLRMVAWYSDAIEGAAKTRAKDDVEFQQFYHLEEGDEVREVTDTGAVFGLLQPHGLTESALLEKCVTIKVGELDKAIHKASGPNIKKDGTPGTRCKITGDEASKIVTTTLMNAGALKMKRNAEKLVEGPKLLEESK